MFVVRNDAVIVAESIFASTVLTTIKVVVSSPCSIMKDVSEELLSFQCNFTSPSVIETSCKLEGANGVVSAGGVTTGEVSAGDSFLHDKIKSVDKNNRVKENILMDDITFFHDLSIVQLQCDDVTYSIDDFFLH